MPMLSMIMDTIQSEKAKFFTKLDIALMFESKMGINRKQHSKPTSDYMNQQ